MVLTGNVIKMGLKVIIIILYSVFKKLDDC
jgi:hypothetical protein